jgi:hypothetical protein
MNNDTPELLTFPELGARIHRLTPHLFGYIPYAFAWTPLLHQFLHSVSNAEQGPPDFVYAIIYSQIALFSSFGVTQFVSLWRNDGPSVYYYNELSYAVLSLCAKGVLGLILMINVLVYDSFDAAVADAQQSR